MRNVIVGSFVGFVLAAAFLAACGGSGTVTPQASVEELTQQVAELQQAVGGLQTDLTATKDALAECQSVLHHFSRVGDEVFITGANLHVVNGTESTHGNLNGRGNVIIGYNEERIDDGNSETPDANDRSGSHMLVVGTGLNYKSAGGIVVGCRNETSGVYASAIAGFNGIASGPFSLVGGGANEARGDYSTCSGGNNKDTTATDDHKP